MASNGLAIGAEALIKAGADVNKPTDRGETPLWIANFSSARDVADLLIAAGATEF
jgi:ankyrin repeat protein